MVLGGVLGAYLLQLTGFHVEDEPGNGYILRDKRRVPNLSDLFLDVLAQVLESMEGKVRLQVVPPNGLSLASSPSVSIRPL